MKKLGYTGTIYAATCIARGKEQALRRRGADLVKHGADCVDAENMARQTAKVRRSRVKDREGQRPPRTPRVKADTEPSKFQLTVKS